MSTDVHAPPPAPPVIPPAQRELRIYSHSALFYWWPVWAVGFIMATFTYFDGYRMAVVPPDTEVQAKRDLGEGYGKADILFTKHGLPRETGEDGGLIKP